MYLEDETPFEWCDNDNYTQRTLDFVTEFPVDKFDVWASSQVMPACARRCRHLLISGYFTMSSHSLSFRSAASGNSCRRLNAAQRQVSVVQTVLPCCITSSIRMARRKTWPEDVAERRCCKAWPEGVVGRRG